MKTILKTFLLLFTGLNLISLPSSLAVELAVNPFTFFDPQGTSSLTNVTARGGTATITDVTDGNGNASRPRVISHFTPADLSQIGQWVQVSFNIVLNNPFLDDNQGDFHISLFDSVAGSELIGLVHMGVNAGRVSVGDFIKCRIDNDITPEGLGVGGQSRGGQAHAPGGSIPSTPGVTLSAAGEVHGFAMRLERISATEHSFSLTWTNSGGSSTYSFNAYNETTGVIDGEPDPTQATDVWGGGALNQLDGFAILLHDDEPFNTDGNPATVDAGSYTISNFSVTDNIPEPLKIINATVTGGQFALSVTNGVPGALARLLATTNVTFPVASWTTVSTNKFDGTGTFSVTNTVSANPPQRFYLISVP